MKKEVSLYIHIPFCLSKCTYCDFFSKPVPDKCNPVPQDYITSLCNEIHFRFRQYGECIIKTIYIGGGTPSLLKEEQLASICNVIFNSLNEYGIQVSPNLEFTFEINPDDVSEQLLKALINNKVNRLSLGVQSFSDTVLKNVHRRADSKGIYNALDLINKHWDKKVSVDLICGLPYETTESMLQGLEYLVLQKISHISFYSLCIEDETPLGESIITGTLPYDIDKTDELWIKGRDFLLHSGYSQYEVSNFCLKDFECLHNMTYWTHKDYIGVGAGAAGTNYNSDGTGIRILNNQDIKEYVKYWKNFEDDKEAIPQELEIISQDTSEFEYFMMGLRTNKGVSAAGYKEIFNKSIPSEIIQKFEEWKEKGWCNICIKENDLSMATYSLTTEGMLFLNRILQELLP